MTVRTAKSRSSSSIRLPTNRSPSRTKRASPSSIRLSRSRATKLPAPSNKSQELDLASLESVTNSLTDRQKFCYSRLRPEMKAASSQPSTVLLVDDSRDGLLVRRALLEEQGFTVQIARNGEE